MTCSLSLAEDDISELSMYYTKEALVVTPARTPKPISQTAENVTVITAKELEELNAHTLEEALNLVTGVIVENLFRNVGRTSIQGALMFHVKMMIDGITLNDLSTNLSTAGLIPIQNVERIEIIKGPASSSWGSSLGGVINIITKNPGKSAVGGILSTSYGEHSTQDHRAEVSGTTRSFGYYVQGGKQISDGFFPNEHFNRDVFYVKLNNAATDRLNMTLTANYAREKFGIGEDLTRDLKSRSDIEVLFSTLSFNYQLSNTSEVSLSLRAKKMIERITDDQLSFPGLEQNSTTEHNRTRGATVTFSSRQGAHNFVIGAEFEQEDFLEDTEVPPLLITSSIDQKRDKRAVFGNDTMTLGKFTVTPGIRYDKISDNENFTSPSLGITYGLTGKTLLRAYAARGFTTPAFDFQYGESLRIMPNPDIRNEKTESVQAGVETTAMPYVWLKTSLFRHSIWDAFSLDFLPEGTTQIVNSGRELLQGVEFEARTVPLYNTSLAAGVMLMSAKDRDTEDKIPFRPAATYNVEVKYKDRNSLLAMITGHYAKWNVPSGSAAPGTDPTLRNSFIWDLHASRAIWTSEKKSAHLFLSVHNLFNGKQYANYLESPRTPDQWAEAGIRVKF